MAEALDPAGGDCRLEEVTLRTPGYAGTADMIHGAGVPQGIRAVTAADGLLSPTFERAELLVQYEIILDGLTSVAAPPTGTVRSEAGEPGIELELPEVAEGWEQMVLATDASGIATWHFASPSPTATPALRGARRRTYRVRAIPTPSPPAAGETTVRGILGGIGHALIRVLAFKLIDPLLGEVGEYFAARWEEQHRPYRVRTFAPEDYASAEAPTFAAADWDSLRGARALLFLHGTFSRAHTAFGGLPRDALLTLHSRYEGRVFAFDHYTLSDDPRRNVEQLLSQIPRWGAPRWSSTSSAIRVAALWRAASPSAPSSQSSVWSSSERRMPAPCSPTSIISETSSMPTPRCSASCPTSASPMCSRL
jgi:hypothetical protein